MTRKRVRPTTEEFVKYEKRVGEVIDGLRESVQRWKSRAVYMATGFAGVGFLIGHYF